MIWRLPLVLLSLTTVLPLAAQLPTNSTATPMGRALLAERNGAYADAVTQYQSVLATQPASLAALAGLERVLPSLDRRADMVPLMAHALAADSGNSGIIQLAIRVFATNGMADSARRYANRWATLHPGDEDGFREWSEAALSVRDLLQARTAIDAARQKLGPHVLGVERAELLQRTGDIAAATTEWLAVVHDIPSYRDGATGMIAQVPMAQRNLVREALQKDGSRDAKQMLGLLQAQWGESADAIASIRASLPADNGAAQQLLQQLLDHLHQHGDRAAQLASAQALELLADRDVGPSATRRRMDAAQIYADAGDERDARRLLGAVAEMPGATGTMSTMTSTTLIGVLVAEGKPAEAEKALAAVTDKLDFDTRDRITRQIAMGWVRAGDFARAEALVVHDSSTDAFDLRGRLHLYRGDLVGATELLKEAGPYDEHREQALERVTLLALIQAADADTLVAMGDALLTLERGDSARAVTALTQLATTQKPAGAAETRLLAARVALAHRDTTTAVTLFQLANVKDVPAAAAAALLSLAEVRIARRDDTGARTILEQLIVGYPDSAVVPEARRLRDSLHAAVGAP